MGLGQNFEIFIGFFRLKNRDIARLREIYNITNQQRTLFARDDDLHRLLLCGQLIEWYPVV